MVAAMQHEGVAFVRVVLRLTKETLIGLWVLGMLKVFELAEHTFNLDPSTTHLFAGLHQVALFATIVVLSTCAILDIVQERWGRNAAK